MIQTMSLYVNIEVWIFTEALFLIFNTIQETLNVCCWLCVCVRFCMCTHTRNMTNFPANKYHVKCMNLYYNKHV
jgi:hypothetical protein